MDKELFTKIQKGEALDARESLMLEQSLEAGDHSHVASWIEALDDPQPSLHWRSNLNSRLREIAPVEKKRFNWFGSGLAIAGITAFSLTFAFIMAMPKETKAPVAQAQPPAIVAGPSDFGSTLVKVHLSDEAEVSGGIRSPRRTVEPAFDWDSL